MTLLPDLPLVFWIAVALQILDILTTLAVLADPRGYESNGIVAKIMAMTGRAWPVVKLAITVPALYFYREDPLILWGICAVMTYVVIHNFNVWRGQRRSVKTTRKRPMG